MLAYILCILVGIPFEFHLHSSLFVDCAIPPPICDPHPNDAHSRRRGRRRARPFHAAACASCQVRARIAAFAAAWETDEPRRLMRAFLDRPRKPLADRRGRRYAASSSASGRQRSTGLRAARVSSRRRRGAGRPRERRPPYPAGAARVKNERGNIGRRRSPPTPARRGARAAFRAVQGGPALPASGGRGSRGAASTPSSAGSGLPGGATSSSSNFRAAGSIRFSSDPTPLL